MHFSEVLGIFFLDASLSEKRTEDAAPRNVLFAVSCSLFTLRSCTLLARRRGHLSAPK